MRTTEKLIAVSIISHGHGAMVERLAGSLLKCEGVSRIIVTKNIPEALELPSSDKLLVIENDHPKGFGANHNDAFKHCTEPFFCPLNPDIELIDNPFPELLATIDRTGSSLVAPLVVAPDGSIEDSLRRFPTIPSLVRKFFKGDDGRYVLSDLDTPFHPEWAAGMFLLFRSTDFARLGGFDEGYFLYYEDVDICVRAWRMGLRITACPKVRVVHDARRDSHRNWRHLRWHLGSMARYFWKHLGKLPRVA